MSRSSIVAEIIRDLSYKQIKVLVYSSDARLVRSNHLNIIQGTWSKHNDLHPILRIDVGVSSHEDAEVEIIGKARVSQEAVESYLCQVARNIG